jgi:hypothetical protein
MTDCFVFPDEMPKKSTRCLCGKITNKTSGPNTEAVPEVPRRSNKFSQAFLATEEEVLWIILKVESSSLYLERTMLTKLSILILKRFKLIFLVTH